MGVKVYHEVVSQMSKRERILWTIRVLLCVVAAPNFLESYLCYTPLKHWEFWTFPWLFQFIKQSNGFTPTTHEWIIFEKTTQAPCEPVRLSISISRMIFTQSCLGVALEILRKLAQTAFVCAYFADQAW